MEQQPLPPEASQESAAEKKNKRRNRLAHWLGQGPGLFRFGEQASPENVGEDQKQVEVKKGRMHRFIEKLRRPFADQVVQVDFVKAEQPKPEKPEPPFIPEQSEQSPAEVEPPVVEAIPTVPEPVVDKPEEQPPRKTVPPATPPPIVPLNPGGMASSPADRERDAAEHLMTPFRGAEATTPPTRTVERVIERPRGVGAVAALLGLEYLGRKRADRKIRKSVNKRFTHERKDTTKEFGRTNLRAQSTEQGLREVREQQEAFAAQLGAERRVKRPPKEVKQQETIRTVEKVITKEKPVDKKVAELVARQTETQPRPEVVQKQVEQAAERNIAIESAFERRHEVKKEQPQMALGGGGGGPSQSQEPILLAQALQQRLDQHTQASGSNAASTSVDSSQVPELYKQAMKSGLWGAVALLLFIGILFLIAR